MPHTALSIKRNSQEDSVATFLEWKNRLYLVVPMNSAQATLDFFLTEIIFLPIEIEGSSI